MKKATSQETLACTICHKTIRGDMEKLERHEQKCARPPASILRRKAAHAIAAGDRLVLGPQVSVQVVAVRPYEGPLEHLRGGVIVTYGGGQLTLEPHVLHEVRS